MKKIYLCLIICTVKTVYGATICDAGYYLNGDTCTACPAGTYRAKPGGVSVDDCTACIGSNYSAAGATSCTPCPPATYYKDRVTLYWYWSKNNIHDSVNGCRVRLGIQQEDPRGTYSIGCSYSNGDYGIDDTCNRCCLAEGPGVTCNGGYYWNAENSYNQIWSNSVESMKSVACIPVGAGYYSTDGAMDRVACPAGQTTIGYGAGADEMTDCGRILHVGSDKVYLRNAIKTTPSLKVKIGDTIYYGNMSAEPHGKIRIKKDNVVYSVYDDSM